MITFCILALEVLAPHVQVKNIYSFTWMCSMHNLNPETTQICMAIGQKFPHEK